MLKLKMRFFRRPRLKPNPLISVFDRSQGHCGSSQPFWSANKSLNVFLVTLNMLLQIRLFSYVLYASEEFVQCDPESACCFVLSDGGLNVQPMTRKNKTCRNVSRKQHERKESRIYIYRSLNLPCTFWRGLRYLGGAWSPVLGAFGVNGWELERKKRGVSIRPGPQA